MRTQALLFGLVLALGPSCGGSPNGGDGSGDGGAGGGGGGGDGEEGDGGAGGGGGGDGADGGVNDDLPYGQCAGDDEQPPEGNDLCLIEENPDDPDNPGQFGVIEQAFVTYDGVEAVHIRVTMDPDFVDNTYGDNSCGWVDTGHSFFDLEESDVLEIVMLSATGEKIFDLFIDYISEDPDSECGYSSLGVDGGEGQVTTGDRDAILDTRTSLSTNFNERGLCYPDSSPEAGDDCCTPPEDAAEWDFRVVYDVWVRRDAFEPVGFGSAYMDYVHASPSKLGPGQNTVEVTPEPCSDDGGDDGGGGGGDDGGGDGDPDAGGGDDGGGDGDPDAGGGGGDDSGEDCTNDDQCGDGQFCYDGNCVDIVID